MIIPHFSHVYKVYTDGKFVRRFTRLQDAYIYCRSVFGSHEIWIHYTQLDKYSKNIDECIDKIVYTNQNNQLTLNFN